jgi:hypothetical protein
MNKKKRVLHVELTQEDWRVLEKTLVLVRHHVKKANKRVKKVQLSTVVGAILQGVIHERSEEIDREFEDYQLDIARRAVLRVAGPEGASVVGFQADRGSSAQQSP